MIPKLSERLRAVYASKLSSSDKALLAYLAWAVDAQTGETSVGIRKMARHTGFGHSTLIERLRGLVRKGWIERIRRGRNQTNFTRLVQEKFGSPKSGVPKSGVPETGVPKTGVPVNDHCVPKPGVPVMGTNPGIKEIRSLSKTLAAGKKRPAAGELDPRHAQVKDASGPLDRFGKPLGQRRAPGGRERFVSGGRSGGFRPRQTQEPTEEEKLGGESAGRARGWRMCEVRT